MFCKEEGLLLMADEVYQTNTWQAKQRPFISFKKVLRDLGKAAEGTELISFHSVSKGYA
jgi:alanine transaminase